MSQFGTKEEIISMLCYAAEQRRNGRIVSDDLARQLADMVSAHGILLADALEQYSIKEQAT